MNQLEEAIKLAVDKFDGHVDKGGNPYIGHLMRVMAKMPDDELKIVAVLHDLLEDTDVPEHLLREKGIPEHLIEAIAVLTKDKSRDDNSGYYDEYIWKVSGNPLARKVKLADLEDNMDITRLKEITDADVHRLRKYHKVWKMLKSHEH